MPFFSRDFSIAFSVLAKTLLPFSKLLIVLAVTPDIFARSRTPNPNAALAIFTCIVVIIGILYNCNGTLYKISIAFYIS